MMSYRSLQWMCSYYYDASRRQAAVKRHGSVTSISSGVNHLPTPSIIRDLVGREFREGWFYGSYPRPGGSPLLQCAIVFDLNDRLSDRARGLISPTNVGVTVGATGALHATFDYLAKEAGVATVLVLGLNYSYFSLCCERLKVRYRILTSVEPGRILPTIAEATAVIRREMPDLVVLTQPGNPSGEVYEEEEIAALRAAVDAQDSWLLLDQVPDMANGIDSAPGPVFAPGRDSRCVVVNSFSKSRSLAGHRMGYIVAPEAIISHVEYTNESLFWSPSHVASSALATDIFLRVLSRRVRSAPTSLREQTVRSTVRAFSLYLNMLAPYSEDYSRFANEARVVFEGIDWEQTLRRHDGELSEIHQLYTDNWKYGRSRLASWLLDDIDARHGFNHCVKFRTPLTERLFCCRAFQEAGLDFYTESAFSDTDDLDRNDFWVRVSCATDPQTFRTGITRLTSFLQEL